MTSYVHISIHIHNPKRMSHRYLLKVFYFLSSFLDDFFPCDDDVTYVFSLFLYQKKNKNQYNNVVLCNFVCWYFVV